jgi:hypothetical protein
MGCGSSPAHQPERRAYADPADRPDVGDDFGHPPVPETPGRPQLRPLADVPQPVAQGLHEVQKRRTLVPDLVNERGRDAVADDPLARDPDQRDRIVAPARQPGPRAAYGAASPRWSEQTRTDPKATRPGDETPWRSRRADARTRTEDPFITRERRVRDGRPLAGTRGSVLAGKWAVPQLLRWTRVPARARVGVPVLYPCRPHTDRGREVLEEDRLEDQA